MSDYHWESGEAVLLSVLVLVTIAHGDTGYPIFLVSSYLAYQLGKRRKQANASSPRAAPPPKRSLQSDVAEQLRMRDWHLAEAARIEGELLQTAADIETLALTDVRVHERRISLLLCPPSRPEPPKQRKRRRHHRRP